MDKFTYKILSCNPTSETSVDVEYEITDLEDNTILFKGIQGVLLTNPDYTVAQALAVMANAVYQREYNKKHNPVIQDIASQVNELIGQELTPTI